MRVTDQPTRKAGADASSPTRDDEVTRVTDRTESGQQLGVLTGQQFGSYRVDKLLGKGGMGEVYLGVHTNLGRKVAIKVLGSRFSSDASWLQRFRREAQMLARLDHPNAVRVYDYGQHGNREYLVMEYIEGQDVEAVMKKRGRMRPTDALAIAKRVCHALHAAHSMEIIHRDIKPSNILITRKKVKVADFGLSRPLEGGTNTTQEGQIIGTPHYMSPEQCQGETLDARSDLYNLGGTLYHLITGVPPYQSKQALSILMMHTDKKVRPEPMRKLVPGIPQEVEDLVARLMAHAPDDRFASANEAAGAIDRVLKALRSGQGLRRLRRLPWLPYTIGAAAIVVGIILAFAINSPDSSENDVVEDSPSTESVEQPTREDDAEKKAAVEQREALEDYRAFVARNPNQLSEIEKRRNIIESLYPETHEEATRLYHDAMERQLMARAKTFYERFLDGKIEGATDFFDPKDAGMIEPDKLLGKLAGLRNLMNNDLINLEGLEVRRVEIDLKEKTAIVHLWASWRVLKAVRSDVLPMPWIVRVKDDRWYFQLTEMMNNYQRAKVVAIKELDTYANDHPELQDEIDRKIQSIMERYPGPETSAHVRQVKIKSLEAALKKRAKQFADHLLAKQLDQAMHFVNPDARVRNEAAVKAKLESMVTKDGGPIVMLHLESVRLGVFKRTGVTVILIGYVNSRRERKRERENVHWILRRNVWYLKIKLK